MDYSIKSALQLLDYGLVSMPLSGKRPMLKGWPNLFKDIPLTPNDILQGLITPDGNKISYSGKNLGILTGEISNVTVLDIDDMSALERLQEVGDLCPSWMVQSGRGVHIYFQYNPRIRSMKLWNSIDILSDGKQVVAPPSIHQSGKRYEWIYSPRMLPKAEMPLWLEELLLLSQNHNPSTKLYTKDSRFNSRDIDWDNIDWISFYSKYVRKIHSSGEFRSCLCPFHKDNKKSFSFHVKTGNYKCFAGCGSGSGLDAVQKLCRVSKRQAIELLKGGTVYV